MQHPFSSAAPIRWAAALALAATLAACATNDPAAMSGDAGGTAVARQAPGQGPAFAAVDTSFAGQVRPAAPVVYAGDTVRLEGSRFTPGQQVTLGYEGRPLVQAVTVDSEGKFIAEVQIPAQAQPGRHPIVVSATGPNAATIATLKISPKLEASGQERFATQSEKLAPGGLYQSAYSAKNNALFVTRAVGRPPVSESELIKVNADTLQELARVTPAKAPDRKNRQGEMQSGGVFAVYGVGVDDARGTVWVTNTRQNTVAVYRQSDLRLVKQLPSESAGHPRDVVIDTRSGKAFVSTVSPAIEVFDTRSFKKTATITIESSIRGFNARPFTAMSLALDAASGKLYVVSSTGELAVVDVKSRKVEKVFAIEGVNGSAGVAYDARSGRLFVASQGSDDLAVIDAASGRVLQRTLVGAGALNVVFDAASNLAYVSNRGAATVTVVDTDGQIVANLPTGPQPNHLSLGKGGAVYLVNAGPQDNPQSGQITRLQAR